MPQRGRLTQWVPHATVSLKRHESSAQPEQKAAEKYAVRPASTIPAFSHLSIMRRITPSLIRRSRIPRKRWCAMRSNYFEMSASIIHRWRSCLLGYPLLFRQRVCESLRTLHHFLPMTLLTRHPVFLERIPMDAVPRRHQYYQGAATACTSSLRLFDSPSGTTIQSARCVYRSECSQQGAALSLYRGNYCPAPPSPVHLPDGKYRLSQVSWQSIPQFCAVPTTLDGLQTPRLYRRSECCSHYLNNESADICHIEAQ